DGCPATQAVLSFITSVYVDPFGNIYISDFGNSLIRKVVASTGLMETVAGGGNGCAGQTDTVGDGCLPTQAILSTPWGVSENKDGHVFIADYSDNQIRKVPPTTGIFPTTPATGVAGNTGDGIPAISAELSIPSGVFGDSAENIYISDSGNYRIREILAT